MYTEVLSFVTLSTYCELYELWIVHGKCCTGRSLIYIMKLYYYYTSVSVFVLNVMEVSLEDN